MINSDGWGKAVRTRGFRAAFIPVAAMALAVFAAGPAFGNHDDEPAQSAGVSNTGSADATTGGNSSTGNDSTNTVETESTGVLGGLIGATVGLGGTSNQSNGTSGINSGPATAAGNQSGTSATQNQGGHGTGTGSGFFTTTGHDDGQHASVGNTGSADANTGRNSSTGNNSVNNATTNQNVSGGLIGVGINLGSTSNNSNGTSNVTTGAANALGNGSNNSVTQNQATGAGDGECSRRGFFDDDEGQRVGVANNGRADADTGGNVSTGNDSLNNVTTGADVTETPTTAVTLLPGVTLPPLIGAGVSLGDTANNSDGTSAIATGAANAAGNQSTNSVTQNCGHVRPVVLHAPHFGDRTHGRPFLDHDGKRVVVGHDVIDKHGQKRGVLALTGLNSGELAGIALALLVVGVLLAASARSRIVAQRQAEEAPPIKRGWEPEERPAPKATASKSGDAWDDLVLEDPVTPARGDDGPSRVEALV